MRNLTTLIEAIELRIYKYAEVDSYEHGCIGGVTDFGLIDSVRVKYASEAQQYLSNYGIEVKDGEFDEDGHLHYVRLEDANALEPTIAEVEEWKKNKLKLWCASYIVEAYMVGCQKLTEDQFKGVS